MIGSIVHFTPDNLLEQLTHLDLVATISIESVPGVVIHFLQFVRAHLLRLEDDLVCSILQPIIGQDAPFLLHLGPNRRMGERSHNGEFGNVEFNLHEEIDQALDIIFILIIGTEDNRSFNADAMLLEALDPVTNNIGSIKNRLINIPGTGLGRENREPRHHQESGGRPISFSAESWR